MRRAAVCVTLGIAFLLVGAQWRNSPRESLPTSLPASLKTAAGVHGDVLFECPTNYTDRCMFNEVVGEPAALGTCINSTYFYVNSPLNGGAPADCNDHMLDLSDPVVGQAYFLGGVVVDHDGVAYMEEQFDAEFFPSTYSNQVAILYFTTSAAAQVCQFIRNGVTGLVQIRNSGATTVSSSVNYPSGSKIRGTLRYYPDTGECEALIENGWTKQHGVGSHDRITTGTGAPGAVIGGVVDRIYMGNGRASNVLASSPVIWRRMVSCTLGFCDNSAFVSGLVACYGDSLWEGSADNCAQLDTLGAGYITAEYPGECEAPELGTYCIENADCTNNCTLLDGPGRPLDTGIPVVTSAIAATGIAPGARWGIVGFGSNDLTQTSETVAKTDYEFPLRDGVEAMLAEGVIPIIYTTHDMFSNSSPPYCDPYATGETRNRLYWRKRVERVARNYEPELPFIDFDAIYDALDETYKCDSGNAWPYFGLDQLHLDHIHQTDTGSILQAQLTLNAINAWGKANAHTLPVRTTDYGIECDHTLEFCSTFQFIVTSCIADGQLNEGTRTGGLFYQAADFTNPDTCQFMGHDGVTGAIELAVGTAASWELLIRQPVDAMIATDTVRFEAILKLEETDDAGKQLIMRAWDTGGAVACDVEVFPTGAVGSPTSWNLDIDGNPGTETAVATGLPVDEWLIVRTDYDAAAGECIVTVDPVDGTAGAGALNIGAVPVTMTDAGVGSTPNLYYLQNDADVHISFSYAAISLNP